MEERRHQDRRSGQDRRASNWKDATKSIPPSSKEALAFRACIDRIRSVTEGEDEFELDNPAVLQRQVGQIEMELLELDEELKAFHAG